MAWIAIIVAIVVAIVGELLRPKQKFNDPNPSAVGDFKFPTVDASRVVPIWWGTCKMMGPNVVWFGDLEVVTLKKKVKTGWFSSKKIVTGYNYYLGVQLVFGYGPADEFIELRVDDKVADLVKAVFKYKDTWYPGAVASKEFVGDKCEFYICSPSILDNGDPPSGVVGKCVLYQGTFTQGTNNYLSGVWQEPDMSAFRPLLHMVMEKCYLGNSDTPPPISIIARRCPNQLGLTGGRHNVNGDANIACAAYELMTNNMWGMKIPEDKIDVDSFRRCGNLTASESLGISMLVQSAMLGKDLLAEVLRHADGVVYADPVTGLYTMTLAREFSEEEKEDLLVIDDSSILEDSFDFSRTSWEMTKNTIIVEYTDRASFETKPVQYQDLANIDVRGGMIDAETFSYLGFSNDTAAMNTAARVSKMKASPLVSAKMSLKRIGYKLRPGSGFWLRKPDRGLANVLMRVIEISYGTLDDPAIKITAMEDIFEVNAVAYVPPGPGDWVPPVTALAPFAAQRVIEAPAFGADDMSRRFLITMGVPASNGVIGYDVWSDPSGATNYQITNVVEGYTPSAVLSSGLSRTGPEVDAVGFTVSSAVGMTGLDAGTDGSREAGENLLLIGNEIMAWKNVVDNGNGTFNITGVYRAVLDTIPQDHASGARVFFLSEGAGTTNVDGYSGNVTVNTKLAPKNVAQSLDINLAAAVTVTTNSRSLRPLPPGRIRVNAAPVPAGATFSGDMILTWAHRNRLDGTIASQADPSRTPEEGTTYNIRVYTSSNAPLVSALAVSDAATAATIRLAVAGDMRIEIESVREGLTSLSKQVAYFSYTPASGTTENTIAVDEPEYVLDGGGA